MTETAPSITHEQTARVQTTLFAEVTQKLRLRAKELLESGEVVSVIGWEAGRFENQTTPAFITDANKVDRLIFNEYCVNTLGKYVLSEKLDGKVAVCVRGCESRGINRMISDNQLKRSEVYLLGLPCPGMVESPEVSHASEPSHAPEASSKLLSKCAFCTHRQPVVFDEYLGTCEATDETLGGLIPKPIDPSERFSDVEELEALSLDERNAYFEKLYNNCIRCYACREVCPCCTCRECFVDQARAGWQGKQNNLEENRFYNLTRVFHIGDRCVECGECERVCPMELPLMKINRKMVKDLTTLFSVPEAGLDSETISPLNTYDVADLEEYL
jgi:ferredoxin